MTSTQKTVLVPTNDAGANTRRTCCPEDFQVETVNDCESVLARSRKGGIDLLVLDHLMPGDGTVRHGIRCLSSSQGAKPWLSIILYTGAWEGEPGTLGTQKKSGARVVFEEVHDPDGRSRDRSVSCSAYTGPTNPPFKAAMAKQEVRSPACKLSRTGSDAEQPTLPKAHGS